MDTAKLPRLPSENKCLQLTVVIATYNRSTILKRTLQHLAEQDIPPGTFEVIVVSDASPDDTRQVVCDFKAPFDLRYLDNSINSGPCHTQNRGILEARAPLVLLIADDIWLAPGALRAHLEMHWLHPAPEAAVAGRVEQSAE